MKRIFALILILTLHIRVFSQQKKPVPKTTPSKSIPVKKEDIKVAPNAEQTKIDKTKDESTKLAEDKKRKDELEAARKRTEQQTILEKQKYEDALRLEKEANARRQQELAIQEAEANNNKFGFGLKIGQTYNTINTSEIGSINKKYLKSLCYGIYINIPMGKSLSLVPELNYITKGLNYEYESDYDRLNMNYVTMPLSIRFDALKTQYYKVYAKVGGYGSYWLSGKLQSSIGGDKSSSKYTFDADFSDGYKDNKIDYGAIGGIGAEIKLMNKYNISIEARYDYGLNSIYKFETIPTNYIKSTHKGFGVFVGLGL